MAKGRKEGATIVIRREEVVEGGHHGGAWKVAYADFVTAMMAFFLLMWLLNATTEQQRRGIADYFTPNNVMSNGKSGSGKIFGGRTPFDHGDLASDRGSKELIPGNRPVSPESDDPDRETSPDQVGRDGESEPQAAARSARQADGAALPGGGQAASPLEAGAQFLATSAQASRQSAPEGVSDAAARAQAAAAARAAAERAAFDRAAEQIRDAVRADPALAGIMSQLAIDQTPEGLRIQLLDEEQRPMFATGSSIMGERARLLLQKIAPVLARLPEQVSVAGHTDAAPFRGEGRSNWDLSSERALATRRLLVDSGLMETRVSRVTGHADRDLLLPADPLAAANRRIAIVVLRTAG